MDVVDPFETSVTVSQSTWHDGRKDLSPCSYLSSAQLDQQNKIWTENTRNEGHLGEWKRCVDVISKGNVWRLSGLLYLHSYCVAV